MHCPHVEKALAGEGAFAKQVLIDLRGCSTVWIDAALPSKEPVIKRKVLGCGQWCDDAGLQNTVAAYYAASTDIELRLVMRMRGHAHQLTQPPRRQLGVAVECDGVLG